MTTAAPLTDDVLIRTPRPADAAGLARVHVAAWQATYRGAMPAAYLDGLDVERWTRGWERSLDEQHHPHLFVAELDGDVVGFTSVGRDRHDESRGELYAINVAPTAWGRGIGSSLLEAAEHELSRLGHGRAVLWVVPSNSRGRRFYERHGWADDGATMTAQVDGLEVEEIRYAKALPRR